MQKFKHRKSVWFTWQGRTHTVAQWARLTGIPAPTIYARIRRGKSGAEILGKAWEFVKHGQSRRGSKSKAYNSWSAMLQRCFYTHGRAFRNYGGRGITVCKRWLKFENFFADMGNPPKGMMLDRKNTNGNYCPENCRWATRTTQNQNRRNAIWITRKGETHSGVEWSRITGLSDGTIYSRVKRGAPTDKLLAPSMQGDHWRKLTEADVRTVLKLRNSGLGYAEIGNLFGVTHSAIYAIVKGKSWKHVPRS